MRGRIYKALARFIFRHDIAMLVGAVLLSLVSVVAVKRLPLDGDLARLLPDDQPSVVALREVVKKLGGAGQLLILATPPDAKTGEMFVEALGPELIKSKVINNVDYRRDLEFFQRHRFLFVHVKDLETIRDRLAAKLTDIKQNHLPFVMKSVRSPEGRPRVEVTLKERKTALPTGALEKQFSELRASFDDIERKYTGGPEDEYFTSKDHKTFMLSVYPSGQSTDVEFAKSMLEEVDTIVRRINAERFGGAIQIEYGGTFKNAIDDYETIINDVERATIITATGLILLLTIMFRQPLILFLLGLPQVMAVLWTFAAAYIVVGSLNVYTVFLFNILFGVGIEFGIQMYARYGEERAGGVPIEESLARMLANTWSACIAAATVAGFAFFSLMVTDFKGFSEFGFISGLGLFVAVSAMLVAFCPLIVRFDKLGWLRIARRAPQRTYNAQAGALARLLPYTRPVLIFTGVVFIASLLGATQISFDYDLSKLKAANPGVLAREKRIASVFNLSLTPAAIIAPDKKRLTEVVEALQERATEGKGKGKGTIATIRSMDSVIPPDQLGRLRVLGELRALLDDELFKLASPEQRREVERIRAGMSAKPVEAGDIPEDLQWKFQGQDHAGGYLAYVYPSVSMDHGESVIAFSNEVSQIPTSSGTLRATSPQLIIGDMLQLMIRDGKLAMLLTFLAVFIVLLVDFRSVRHTVILMLPVTIGLGVLLGIMAIFDLKFDLYNMVAMPAVAGLAINNAIYLYHRYREEGTGRLMVVMRTTGVAVFITAMAMIMGFLGLLFADHPGLRSIGTVAVLGISTVLLSLLTFFPAFLLFLESGRPVPVTVIGSGDEKIRLRS
ncbi:MAG: MMPL family transporter [Deltaproteobacteria bacterium]|nr:MMPL family transporter [Deltaproteobacteria bacterium]